MSRFVLFFHLQVKIAYINFLNHCYVDTEVEMKEIYTSNHMWKLFENFLVDICRVRQYVKPKKHSAHEQLISFLRSSICEDQKKGLQEPLISYCSLL